jgi:hypothetical protein
LKRARRTRRLSPQQQELVRENLGLVGVHLNRRVPGAKDGRTDREWSDLYQEGCLGLMQAAADYDPASGIKFAAFALRRIQRAVGAALVRRFSLVRAPMSGVERARRSKAPASGHAVRRARLDNRAAAQIASSELELDDAPSIGHRLHERYLRALTGAASELASGSSSTQALRAEVIEAVAGERMAIASAAWRPSLRRLAQRVGCPYAAVAACERRLLKEVKARLLRDGAVAALVNCAWSSPLGMRQPVDADIDARVRDSWVIEFMRLLSGADDFARSRIVQRLLSLASETLAPAIYRSLSALPERLRDQLLAEAREATLTAQRGNRPARRCA